MWLTQRLKTTRNKRTSDGRRFAFIEELRGVAALAVVLYHAHEGRHIAQVMTSLPAWAQWPIEHGYLGVAVFFVLSGFVVAHSLAGRDVTAAFAFRYLTRRFLRLAPPYWVAIMLVIVFAMISDYAIASRKVAAITPGQIVAHLLYLQDAFGYSQISPVFWTLCLEIQFYVVFVALLYFARRMAGASGTDDWTLAVLAASALVSAMWPLGLVDSKPWATSFLVMWYSFLLGAGAFWSWQRPQLQPFFLAFSALLLAAGVILQNSTTVTCSLTALILWNAARCGFLQAGIGWRWLQMLGAISYSLYLTHNVITGATVRVGHSLTGHSLGYEIFWWAIALAASIAVSVALWHWVEKPSISLAGRVKLGDGSHKTATASAWPNLSNFPQIDNAQGLNKPVMLCVSGTIASDIREQIASGARPRADYLELARTLDADLVDFGTARATNGRFGAILERLGGANVLLAYTCWRRRKVYKAIVTDGEQIGLPLAALLKLTPGIRPCHLMIVHVLSVPKKMLFLDWLGVQSCIDRFVTYSHWQKQFIEHRWQLSADRVAWTPFMVDHHFFAPDTVSPKPTKRPQICAVGLERRDYATLLEAVQGLDADVVIAAASPWSKIKDTTSQQTLPSNVTVKSFSQYDLRQLYAESQFLVMPLQPVDFQAGITAILEAMAMGKAVVCSRVPGQSDAVLHGENGLYVDHTDPMALRRTITLLLSQPELAAQMGTSGRQRIESHMNLDRYAQGFAKLVKDSVDSGSKSTASSLANSAGSITPQANI